MSEPIITQAELDGLRALADLPIEKIPTSTKTLRALLGIIAKHREALKDIDGIEHAHLCDCVACSEIGEVARAALDLVKE